MPTYVYECSSCKQRFEVEQRITEDPLNKCQCGSKGTVKRLIQPVGVMFKGAGFHINDYSANASPATESKADKAADSSSTGDPGNCACSKPAES